MKRILIILLVILIAVALGIGGYYLRSKQEAITPPPQTTNALPSPGAGPGNQQTTLPSQQQPTATTTQGQQIGAVGGSKLSIVSQSQALDYFVDKGSNTFILQPDGRVIKMSGASATKLSDTPLAGIVNASFSYDGKKIMAYIGGGSSDNKAHIFDTDSKTWTLFPNVAQSPVWAPDSHKVVYLSPVAGGANAVYLADADNSRTKPSEIARLHGEELVLSWPNSSTIFLGERPNSVWASSFWSLNIQKKTVSPVLADLPGLETVWSSSTQPTGLVFSSGANGNGGKLQLVNQNGGVLQVFNFLTLPSKCAFYDKPVPENSVPIRQVATSTANAKTVAPKSFLTLLCAIPRDRALLDNSPLPDAYLQKTLFTSDDFFEINVSTGEIKSVLSSSSQNLDADNMKIFNQTVFFINRYDKKIYSIALPK